MYIKSVFFLNKLKKLHNNIQNSDCQCENIKYGGIAFIEGVKIKRGQQTATLPLSLIHI